MKKIWYAPNEFESYGDEEMNAVMECLKDGWLAGFGKKSVEFEEKYLVILEKNTDYLLTLEVQHVYFLLHVLIYLKAVKLLLLHVDFQQLWHQ